MKYLKVFESYQNENISDVIIRVGNEFTHKHKCSHSDINKGMCVDFIDEFMDNFDGSFETLTTNMFVPSDNMKEHNISKYNDVMIDCDGVQWSKNMLDEYGYPEEFFMDEEPPGHIWIYYNKKHYDAETPHGVDTPWDLPFFDY